MPDPLLLDAGKILVAALVVLIGGTIRGFSGFGGPLAMTPALTLLWPPVQVVAVVIVLELAAALHLVPGALPNARRRVWASLAAPTFVFIPVGTWILVTVDADLMRRIIAAVVLVFVGVIQLGWRYRGSLNIAVVGIAGTFSGLLTGSTGMGGPPVVLCLIASGDPAATTRANLIVFFAVTDIALVLVLAWAGLFTWPVLWTAAALVPVYALAIWAGGRLFGRASDAQYRRFALGFLGLAAVFVLVA